MTQTYKKKLIEVAIPVEAINSASAEEILIRHNHPSTIHLWWARRPLASCSSIIFCQLVDDPSNFPTRFATEDEILTERFRLFKIAEKLATWKYRNDKSVVKEALTEIKKSCEGSVPRIHDPFSGGASIPIEAQRLGLKATGSDLNPVAVMIGKALVEIPSNLTLRKTIDSPIQRQTHYSKSELLSNDMKYFADELYKNFQERIRHIYPTITTTLNGKSEKLTVFTWLWARTVPSPDPAYSDCHVPLTSNFMLSTKKGKEVCIVPEIDKWNKNIEYKIQYDPDEQQRIVAKSGTKLSRGANFVCLLSGAAITPEYVKECGKKGLISQSMIAIVAINQRSKVYLPPNMDQEKLALDIIAPEFDDLDLPRHPQYVGVRGYGIEKFKELFSSRQLFALMELSNALKEIADLAHSKYLEQYGDEFSTRSELLEDANKYKNAVTTYLAFIVDRCADYWSRHGRWQNKNQQLANLFGRHAIPMVWDFPEANPLSGMGGSFKNLAKWTLQSLATLPSDGVGAVWQCAAQELELDSDTVICTDPPYYDNIPYADISDFFYVWLRKNLKEVEPELFSTLSVPKMSELVADRVRHGSPDAAEMFFLNGMKETFSLLQQKISPDFPISIYYAFKQSEVREEGLVSTGWAAFLEGVISSGLQIVRTWPLRTEMTNRIRGIGSNALANSVVLVCRKRAAALHKITRAEFIRELTQELPLKIKDLQSANVSPADMPQCAIGPGISIFSKYGEVLETNDKPMNVKTALTLINEKLDEYLNNMHGDFDSETRFAASWFEQNGYKKGDFGIANNLATARGISVESVKHAGIIESSAGSVRILKRNELNPNWDPNSDVHLTVWECCQYLIREYEEGGETAAAMLIKKFGYERAESVKDLSYYLYDMCSKKLQSTEEAAAYNALISGWSDITRLADSIHDTDTTRQASLF